MSFSRQLRQITILLVLSVALASCTVIGGGKELTTYDLSAASDLSDINGRSNAQILVQVPTALKSLDSEMIVVRPNSSEITYFGDAQWSDSLPRVLQDKLIQTFENSNRIRSVVKPGDGVSVDYKLATSIRAFELIDDDQTVAKVSLSIKLINDRTGRVRASRQFQAVVPANIQSTAKAVHALDVALNSVLHDILAWVVKTI
ncbi:ABC-type transport auxiliary lipoprotein family protein [uncultured Cohaesibacter sp.]|uniref:ABC-type transport auxiliary lipoprotein family protein n=1 Tax=uncultured Cohaesibacter sp. TaxID=1002546 RepID=UPI00293128A9|nr:ABC-type transport auxiliary lipoprotein family protein [uncultured Cohaesibacter sp.]